MRYVTRRIIFYLVAIFASLTINFFIPRLMPGDPASAMMARFQGQMRPDAITSIPSSGTTLRRIAVWRQHTASITASASFKAR